MSDLQTLSGTLQSGYIYQAVTYSLQAKAHQLNGMFCKRGKYTSLRYRPPAVAGSGTFAMECLRSKKMISECRARNCSDEHSLKGEICNVGMCISRLHHDTFYVTCLASAPRCSNSAMSATAIESSASMCLLRSRPLNLDLCKVPWNLCFCADVKAQTSPQVS